MPDKFRIAVTADFRNAKAEIAFPLVDLEPLASDSRVELTILPDTPIVDAEALKGHDALILIDRVLARESIPDDGRLAAVIRFGAGYDKVAIERLTEQGILLCNAPDGMQRPVAVAALTLLLALSGRLRHLDELARSGPVGWARAYESHGIGLEGRVLGLLGAGRIGCELIRLCKPLGMKFLVHDPYIDRNRLYELGIEPVKIEDLFVRSDFLSVHCPLNKETAGIVSKQKIQLMKPTAFLINTSRGRVVDQEALTEALQENRIAGAGLDVLCIEPPPADDPITKLDNVILTPHALCVTDQCYESIGRQVVKSLQSIMSGSVPKHVLNDGVLSDLRLQHRIGSLKHRFTDANSSKTPLVLPDSSQELE